MKKSDKLIENVNKRGEKVIIKDINGNILDIVSIYYIMIFKMFDPVLENRWQQNENKKIFVLDDSFGEKKTKYFLYLIKNIYDDFAKCYKNQKERFWFCDIADRFLMDDDIFEEQFSKEKLHSFDWETIRIIGKYYNNQIMGPAVTELYNKSEKSIDSGQYDIDDVPDDCFNYDKSREFIIKYFKSDNYKKQTEDELFKNLIKKIIKIKNEKEYILNLPDIYNLLTIIRWFFVPEKLVQAQFAELKKYYPEFEMPDYIQDIFSNKEKMLLDNHGSFYYEQGKNLGERINNKYIFEFCETDDESSLSFGQGLYSVDKKIATTTMNPKFIEFSVYIDTTHGTRKALCIEYLTKIPGKLIICNISVLREDHSYLDFIAMENNLKITFSGRNNIHRFDFAHSYDINYKFIIHKLYIL